MLRRNSRLTSRQRAILAACATGLLSVEVAEHLHLSPDDIRAEIAEVIQRLGARLKLEAVVIALRSHEIVLEVAFGEHVDGTTPPSRTDRQGA